MRKIMVLIVFPLVILSLSQAVSAQTSLKLSGFGGRLSLVKPQDIDMTFGLGAHADLGTLFNPAIHFFPSVEFWWKSTSTVEFGEKYQSKFTEIALNADIHYYIQTSGTSKIKPYVGGGLALIYSKASVDVPHYGDQSSSDTDIGLDFLGGIEFPLGSSSTGMLEAKYKIDGADAFKITVGFTLPTGG